MGNNWEKRDRKREKRNDIKEMNSVKRQEQGYDKQKQDRDKELSIRKKQYIKTETNFNLVTKDTSTAVQRSMLECKKCTRTISFG